MRAIFTLLTAAAVASRPASWPCLGRGQSRGDRNSAERRQPAQGDAVPPRGPGAVSGGRRSAQLHRPQQPRRHIRRALSGLGRTPRQGRLCRADAGQQRLARGGQPVRDARALDPQRPRARGRRRCGARLAAIAIMGRSRPRRAARLVERRHRRAVGGAGAGAAATAIQGQPRFPLRGRVLSGLPAAQQRRLERAGADLDPDRARRRPGFGRDLPADGGGRARPQRPGRDPRLSRRPPRFRPSEPAVAAAHRAGVFGGWQRPRAQRHQSEPPAPMRSSACPSGSAGNIDGWWHAAGRDIRRNI